ncbi:bolA-like protein 2 isoform X2 [Syngnathoides biaculeatus]|uniref:bolA-like protein 2 isoform X2 n=1 Tax=Syngnathoides biaculeatus TaxID=300417 RepID=UPI002ADE092B|nr:bolA-like protein 2 isoform X2 [Syngnathoides biaculeatus]
MNETLLSVLLILILKKQETKPVVVVVADMSITTDHIRDKLKTELAAEHVDVEDMSPNRCATSFKVLVVSSQFEGKPLLQRHRMVNACLAEELKDIHALEQKTLTPEQWEKQKSK